MKKRIKLWPMMTAVMALMAMLAFGGCKTKLENGGAYAPGVTNSAGVFVPAQQADLALFVTDSAHRLAYDAISAVFKLEAENRAQLQSLAPKLKPALDDLRPKVWAVERRWAAARQAYQLNPVPANLTTVQQIVAEIQQLVPVAQSQLALK